MWDMCANLSSLRKTLRVWKTDLKRTYLKLMIEMITFEHSSPESSAVGVHGGQIGPLIFLWVVHLHRVHGVPRVASTDGNDAPIQHTYTSLGAACKTGALNLQNIPVFAGTAIRKQSL